MANETIHTPPAPAVHAATPSNSPPPPASTEPPAVTSRPLAPPYGAERPDYDKWKYGYPPFSGRMFGSGR
jgi:hypothetical protein